MLKVIIKTDTNLLRNSGMALLLIVLLLSSCTKMVTVDSPVTSVPRSTVYANDATAIAVLTGIYSNISSGAFKGGGIIGITTMTGLSGDEISLFNGQPNAQYAAFYTNNLSSKTFGFEFWNNFYPVIFNVNSAIESLSDSSFSSSLTPTIRRQLLGEAKFIRAFSYFYLVNLYGDLPLVTGTDYTINQRLPKTSKNLVWAFIKTDLIDAQSLLSGNYLTPTLLATTSERVRPTKWAALSLLSRACLYTGAYDSARLVATTIINNSQQFGLTGIDTVFLKNNREAIWQLQPVIAGQNTQDALAFVLPAGGPSVNSFPFYMNPALVNSFEGNDFRKTRWTGNVIVGTTTYYYANKYKVNIAGAAVTEYENVLRLGEQYLIRAEANAQLGSTSNSLSDLNAIRTRAGLGNYSGATDQASLLKAIYHERQVELFFEWGHRWLDLKRTGTINSVLGSPGNITQQKGGVWNSDWQLYPLPLTDLNTNSNLVQNSSY